MGESEDRRLLQDCLEGGPEAWEAFARRFRPALAQVCRRLLVRSGLPCGPQEVDDLLQDTFAALLEGDRKDLRAFRGRSSLLSYLSAVAAHRACRVRRIAWSPLAAGLTDPGPRPEEAAQAREDRERAEEALGRLPPRTRLLLGLWARGATAVEIGQALGISEDAAAQALGRARALLRKTV